MKKILIATLTVGMIMTMVACSSGEKEQSSMIDQSNQSSDQTAPDTSEKPEVGGTVQIPNPIVSYDTSTEVSEIVGFVFGEPTMPKGYELEGYSVINHTLAQALYINGENEINFRASAETGDNSGDYNSYDITNTLMVDEIEVTTKGTEETIYVATWTKDDVTYSVRSTPIGMSDEELTILLESVL